jgi:hypothetical protein
MFPFFLYVYAMKYLFILLLIPTIAFSQRNKEEEILLDNTHQYGYVNGVRLDSINAIYGQAGITAGMTVLAGNYIRRLVFEYGQHWKNESEARITNKEGKAFTFFNTAEALNFFEYNGWNFVLVNLNPYQILLRKKDK